MNQPDRPSDDAPISSRISRARLVTPGAMTLGQRLVGLSRRAVAPKARVYALRALIAPLVLALVPFYWVADATYRATLTTIGRDQGIFQYIAWAVLRGDVDYRDIRDVNGPLVHLLHVLGLLVGAGDEHRFHVLDHAITGVSFAIVGALLPGIFVRVRSFERIAWALAGWVVLAAQYALYLYWNQAQRESFCDWFLLPSLALQIARPAKSATRRIVVVAALSTITWFAKPVFVLFTAAQLASLLLDDDVPLTRRARLAWFTLGGMLGAVPPLTYLLRFGDLTAFVRVTARDVPQVYRYIWAKSTPEILGDEGPLSVATMGLAAAAILLAAIAMRALPRRMLALALAPICGILAAVAQHKGFGYHFHPLTAATHMAFLVIAVLLWERHRFAPRSRALGRWVALGVVTTYAFLVASNMKSSPHTKNVWILAGGETEKDRLEQEYFDSFKSHDFFPWELRQGARWLSDVTEPSARVQMYAMDPYFLFLAQRRSATPYIYAYDLNADAALDGGFKNRPTPSEADHIKAVRADHEADMLARLEATPPEAFVFVDHSPLITYADAWEDFRNACPKSARWVARNYHPARSFGEVHVWLRDDLPVREHEGPP
jgi:hypothetical protein